MDMLTDAHKFSRALVHSSECLDKTAQLIATATLLVNDGNPVAAREVLERAYTAAVGGIQHAWHASKVIVEAAEIAASRGEG